MICRLLLALTLVFGATGCACVQPARRIAPPSHLESVTSAGARAPDDSSARTSVVDAARITSAHSSLDPIVEYAGSEHPFDFRRDVFAFSNELVWHYSRDPATGLLKPQKRPQVPKYALRCFPMTRAVRQFFFHASFDPARPKAEDYRPWIRQVLSSPGKPEPVHRITIPGYAGLKEFSREHEDLLKSMCGGRWSSYLQRGNWRMVFPLSRRHQAREAERLVRAIRAERTPIVHLVRFPQLTINHALLLFQVAEAADEIRFAAYDPNHPEEPAMLTFDRKLRRFRFAANDYFAGGRVDVYEIYRNLCY